MDVPHQKLNNWINSLHKKASRLTYQNKNSHFDELLRLEKSVSIHCRNLQYLLTETYKVKMTMSPPIKNGILNLDQNPSYNLRSGVTVTRRNIRTNEFDLILLVGLLEQFCGEIYQTTQKIQIVQKFVNV